MRRNKGRGNRGFFRGVIGYIFTLATVISLILVGIYVFTAHGDEASKKYDNAWDAAINKANELLDRDYKPDVDKINEKGSEIENGIRSGEYKSKVNEAFGNINPNDYQANFAKAVEQLKGNISKEVPAKGYSRKQFMANGNWNKVSDKNSVGWEDFKPSNCSVRQAVVLTVGENVKVSKNKCKPASGKWVDPYGSGRSTTNSSKFDLDHIVALSNAWKSGASTADWDTRNKIANDKANLILSDSSANRSKGDQSIDEWAPKKGSPAYCDYAARYAIVKARYNLTVTQAEYDKLNSISQTCQK